MGLFITTHIVKKKQNGHVDYVASLLEGHVNILIHHGFSVDRIHLDPEFGSLEQLGVGGVPESLMGPNTHVKIAERAIRTVKERFRAVRLTLPWRLPFNLFPSLVSFVVFSI